MVSAFRGLKHSRYVGKMISFRYITLPPKHKVSSRIIYTLMRFLEFTFKPRVSLGEKKKGKKSEMKERKIRELTAFFFFFFKEVKETKG